MSEYTKIYGSLFYTVRICLCFSYQFVVDVQIRNYNDLVILKIKSKLKQMRLFNLN